MTIPAPKGLVWCSLCSKQTVFLKIPAAAAEARVSTKTIYRYIEQGTIFAVKVAGKNYRVCIECLFRPDYPGSLPLNGPSHH